LGGVADTKEKASPLFLVEAPKAEGIVVCFHGIRKGATACVKKCQSNHGKMMILTPDVGILFSLRRPTKFFIGPVMYSGLLLDELFDNWMHGERTIKSWGIIFSLVTSINSVDLSKELMAKSKAHCERAVECKTTLKTPGGFDLNDEAVLPELE
jgi:glutamate mutase epsilon subunit